MTATVLQVQAVATQVLGIQVDGKLAHGTRTFHQEVGVSKHQRVRENAQRLETVHANAVAAPKAILVLLEARRIATAAAAL
eukprot:CAMPEP_0206127074 /NCGR_PEP_ID=MMETSP1472-20131121/25178_1 /ASSEMBLY_ACC=CAM_ASM_001108 /TAXON_ID=41880 /ORGANISM="Pycnococcus provasolii, Strain RCC251" /LENGTH=80 /DNA_ID=CAMNT_0053518145 /DNA_START=53 /DNA_END=295 /DNA_ORIENTATION=+